MAYFPAGRFAAVHAIHAEKEKPRVRRSGGNASEEHTKGMQKRAAAFRRLRLLNHRIRSGTTHLLMAEALPVSIENPQLRGPGALSSEFP
jgi:hypothetical protein